MSETTIPKVIHYCWFGGKPLPELAQKCMESWKRYCPDYEIKRWDETNFDLNYNDYVREAYEAKKWAFLSDVARLYVLVEYGGIYMDTDVEVLKPLDELLKYEAVSGFESEQWIPTGLMASIKGQKMFVELLHDYDGAHFKKPDGTFDETTNVTRITNACLKYGFIPNNTLQVVNGLTLLPSDYLCPKDPATRELNITEHSLTIHHFDGSWLSDEDKLGLQIFLKYRKYMPDRLAGYLSAFASIKRTRGIKKAVKESFSWLKRKSQKGSIDDKN